MKLPASRATNWSPRFWSSGISGARRAARICSRVQVLAAGHLCDGLVTVFSPMGLNEDAVDLFEVHDAVLVADGFDERTQAEIAGAAQQAFAGTHDQGQRFGREGVMCWAGGNEPICDPARNGRADSCRGWNGLERCNVPRPIA